MFSKSSSDQLEMKTEKNRIYNHGKNAQKCIKTKRYGTQRKKSIKLYLIILIQISISEKIYYVQE